MVERILEESENCDIGKHQIPGLNVLNMWVN